MSCNFKKKNNKIEHTIKCPSESAMMNVEGDLFIDSKGNVLVDFEDLKYNGKLKLIMSDYEYTYKYYDAFLSFKNFDEKTCKATIFGHYIEPIDTTNWLNDRKKFHVHALSFSN